MILICQNYKKNLKNKILPILFLVCISSQAVAQNAVVVTSQHLATDVGIRILQQGGNAIDAAVAIGYALAVVEPCCGNIGGGGFMLIHLANGKNIFLDFRERAPLAIKADLYLTKTGQAIPEALRRGYLAVAVPGTVLGLNTALRKYGTLPLATVMQPAIELANNGFRLTAGDVRYLEYGTNDFKNQPNVAAIFLKNGEPYQVGDILIQKNLASTLQKIATGGAKAFYEGTIADQIITASKAHGGVLTKEDFASYQVKERTPIICNYRGYEIITAGPPSGGGITLCEMLNITETYPLHFFGFRSAVGSHYIIEAMRHAYADRNQYLGDPDFVHNPVSELLSPQHAAWVRSHISSIWAGDSHKVTKGTVSEQAETTHYSVVDKYGNAVAVTYTINGFFGSKIIAGNTGFFLNNEMDDFTLQPNVANSFQLYQGTANLIAPGKRPLSSMAPTIILKNQQLFMVLGTPGGSTIPTQLLETIENVIDYNMNLQQAVDAPRFHMQWLPDVVYMEPYAFSFLTLHNLQMMGYSFQPGSPYGTSRWGVVAAILRDPATGKYYGAIDKRVLQGSAKAISNKN